MIQLGYTKVYSPISGIIGKDQGQGGRFRRSGIPIRVNLNTVSRIDTVLVEFFITESAVLEVGPGIFIEDHSREKSSARTRRFQSLELILVRWVRLRATEASQSFVGSKGAIPPPGPCWCRPLFPTPRNCCVGRDSLPRSRPWSSVVKGRYSDSPALRCGAAGASSASLWLTTSNTAVQRREMKVRPQRSKNSGWSPKGLKLLASMWFTKACR
jgi:hypothetical protein